MRVRSTTAYATVWLVATGGGDFFLVGARFCFEENYVQTLLGSWPAVIPVCAKLEQASVLCWALERFKVEICGQLAGASLTTKHLANIMLIQVLRLFLTSEDRSGACWLFALADPQLGAAVDAMHAEVSRKWSLKELSRLAGMSRSGFAKKFKDVAGISPMEYLLQWRMHLAASQLRTTGRSVGMIANAVGYDSETAFSTAFKKAFGRSPKPYQSAP